MKGRFIILALLSAAFPAVSALRAETAEESRRVGTPEAAKPTVEANRYQPVSLDVKQKQLGLVLRELSDISGINLVLDPEIDELVTIRLINVPWEGALKEILEQTRTMAEEISANLIRIHQPPRVTAFFKDAPLGELLTLLAKQSGANVVFSPADVQGKTITMRFQNVPWNEALQSIVRNAGLAIVEEPYNILRVVPPATLLKQMQTRIFRLKHLHPPDAYVANIKTEYAKGDVKPPTGDPKQDFPLIKVISNSLSRDGTTVLGTLEYDALTNTILVNDIKPVLDTIEKIIQALDRAPEQVLIECRVVSTKNEDIAKIGFRYSSPAIGADPGIGITSIPSPTSKTTRMPFGFGAQKPVGDQFFLTDFQVTTLLQLIHNATDTKILQAPSLTVVDNEEATIFVGDSIRWAQTEASASQAGALTFNLKEAPQSPVNVGFQLHITPHIIRETNQVMLSVIPQTSELVGTSTELPGFDEFTLVSGGSAGTQKIFLPRVRSSAIVTKILVGDGNTAVMGGLIKDNESFVRNSIPLLGDIPVLEYFLTNREKSVTRDHLIIFLTPRIVKGPAAVQEATTLDLEERQKNEKDEFDKMRDEARAADLGELWEDQRRAEEDEFDKLRRAPESQP